MTLDQLKQDLFERFIRAFDEFDRIAEKKTYGQPYTVPVVGYIALSKRL